MPRRRTHQHRRLVRYGAGTIGLAALFHFVPLFHVVPLEETRQQAATTAFDAAGFVDQLWSGPLSGAADSAVGAATLIDALQHDFENASARYGHRLGLSRHTSYLVSGQGRVVAADDMSVLLTLDDDDRPEIVIDIGPVFGNAVRDGSGLLDVSRFANAQDFNAISAEINLRVEAITLPELQSGAKVGAVVRFAGGIEIPDGAGVPLPLTLVPVVVEFP